MSAIGVASIEEAQVVCSIEPPVVILTAFALADGDAPRLLESLGLTDEHPCVLVVDPPDDAALPSGNGIHPVRRPLDEAGIQKLLESTVCVPTDQQLLFRLPEYVQLLCLGRHSARMGCYKERQCLGEILIRDGQLWSARDDEGEGEDALRRMLAADDAHAVAHPLGESTQTRSINRPWELVLLEAASAQDESRHRVPEPSVADYLKQASAAVLSGDLQKAADCFGAAIALAPDDGVIRHNVERLRRLGYESTKEQERD